MDATAHGCLWPSGRATSWRTASIILAASLVLVGAIHRITVGSLLLSWSRDPFSHAYFVVGAVAYLAWSQRADIKSLSLRPSFAAVSGLGILTMVWLVGNLTTTSIVMELCLVPMFIAMTWAVLGTSGVRALLFPLGLLVFAVPFGDLLAPTLQDVTARIAVTMLAASNVHPVLEGRVISIADNQWIVAEACGGINYLVASLAVGYLYAGVVYRQWRHRTALMVAAAVVPLAANAVRVYTTILLAHFGATRLVSGMEHELYGVLVFALCQTVLFITCGRWREAVPTGHDVLSLPPRGIVVLASPSTWRTLLCAAVGVLVVALGPLAAGTFSIPHGAKGTIEHRPPALSSPWMPIEGNLLSWSPRFLAPHAEALQAYTAADSIVQLYVAQYDVSQSGVKVASRGNLLYDDAWWSVGGHPRPIVLAGQSFEVNERRVQSSYALLRLWSWYRIDESFTGNLYATRWLLARARLRRVAVGAEAFVLATEERPGLDAAAVLGDFLRHISLPHAAIAIDTIGAPATPASVVSATGGRGTIRLLRKSM